MIDSIGFKLDDEKIPQLKGLEYNWGTYHKATLGNLNITQMPDGIYINGSIAKFLNGENTTTLNRDSVIRSLKKMEAQTGWDLHKAVLMQLEVGCTVPVKEASYKYLRAFGRVPRYKLIQIRGCTLESVTNVTKNKSFIVYDKKIEAGKKIPPVFSGMELVRMELKYKKQLKKYLGVCSPWDLTEPEFYTRLVNHFRDFYFSIPKRREPVLDITDAVTPKDINGILKVAGANILGDDLSDSLEFLTSQGKLGRTDRVRRAFTDAGYNPKYSDPDKLIKELDSQVIAMTMF